LASNPFNVMVAFDPLQTVVACTPEIVANGLTVTVTFATREHGSPLVAVPVTV